MPLKPVAFRVALAEKFKIGRWSEPGGKVTGKGDPEAAPVPSVLQPC